MTHAQHSNEADGAAATHAGCSHGHVHDHGHAHGDGRKPEDERCHDSAAEQRHAQGCCAAPTVALAPLVAAEKTADGVRTAIRIMQMDCPTEEALIRGKLGGMPSVASLDFNLMQRTLTVVHANGALEHVLDAIRTLGFTPQVARPDAAPLPAPVHRSRIWPLGLALAAALASEAANWLGFSSWIAGLAAGFAVALCGVGTYRKGWIAIRNANLNINALMSFAVTGAMLLGQWPEAAMVMVLFTLAELIEAKSLDRARNAIQGLMRLAPETATVREADGSWRSVEAPLA